tara:strand:+ start:6416 stop:6709 length:294 start_codon:yes stop_codon:yes gene_type:complete
MKQLLYISLIALICSCSGSQLFLEARTTYDVPLNNNGHINKTIMESDAKNVSGLDQFNPQIRLTYRQYLFDGKKNQIKNIVKKQITNQTLELKKFRK